MPAHGGKGERPECMYQGHATTNIITLSRSHARRTEGVLLGDGVLEDKDRGDDDDHALDAVADGVRDGADALENHVGDLLVGVEAEPGQQRALEEQGVVGDAGGREGRGQEGRALHDERDRGQDEEGEDGDDGEEVDVVKPALGCGRRRGMGGMSSDEGGARDDRVMMDFVLQCKQETCAN